MRGKIYCSNCGGEISEEAIICPHCGVVTETGEKLESEYEPATIILSYIGGLFVPMVGWYMAYKLFRRDQKGHAIGIALISTLSSFVYIGIL
jgi:hypothetical protein